jgi:hypothetical protein
MSILPKFNNAIDEGVFKEIFTHIRNYVVCSLILAAGFHTIKNPRNLLFGTKADEVAGVVTMYLVFC